MFERLRRLYYWRGMYADVEWYIASCPDCATAKGKPRYKGRTTGNVVATRPFQVVAMDFAIPLPKTHNGNEAMLCCICLFTSYIVLIPMADTSAQSVAEAYLAGVYKRFGAQEMIRHDRDPRFMSSVFKRFNRMMNQKQRPTLAYRPQANGKQERSIQTVVRAIKCYMTDPEQKDWDEYVNQLELALNTSVNLQQRQTSYYLVHGWNPRTQLEAAIPPKDGTVKERNALEWRENVVKEHEKALAQAEFIQQKLMTERAEQANQRVEDALKITVRTEYQVGELVWLYHVLVKEGLVRKLSHLWHGPYRVEERVNESVYRLKIDKKDSTVLPLVHISRLKPFVSRMARPRERVEGVQGDEFDEALLPEDSWYEEGADDEYEVEKVLECRYKQRTRNGRRLREYLVKWEGYDEPSWVPEEDLSCTALLYEFDARKAWENRQEAAQTTQEEEVEESDSE